MTTSPTTKQSSKQGESVAGEISEDDVERVSFYLAVDSNATPLDKRAAEMLRSLYKELRLAQEALAGVLPYMEAAETAGLVGNEGCHWPVELVRHALALSPAAPLTERDNSSAPMKKETGE